MKQTIQRLLVAVLDTLGAACAILLIIAVAGFLIWCSVEIWTSDMPRIVAIVALWRFWVIRKKG